MMIDFALDAQRTENKSPRTPATKPGVRWGWPSSVGSSPNSSRSYITPVIDIYMERLKQRLRRYPDDGSAIAASLRQSGFRSPWHRLSHVSRRMREAQAVVCDRLECESSCGAR